MLPFGEQLRRRREAAGLTAEAIAALERGRRRRPYPHTVRQLAEALALSAEERAVFTAAVPSRAPAPIPTPPAEAGPTYGRFAEPPGQLTELIGRERELDIARQLLGRAGVRLLTLTGPGGVGKTRLALRLAGETAAAFADGVAFVALAPLDDPALVPGAIARALGVRDAGGPAPLRTVAAAIGERRLLLLLDNFEQVAGAAPAVAELLLACPHLKALVTSRVPLHVRGEQEYRVPPLEPPPAAAELATLLGSPAVQLFVARAQAALPEFALAPDNAAAVAAICRRLDGLPLAIELAAARLKLFSPAALLERLESGPGVLAGGARDLPARQRTMRDAIAWSHDLLDPGERVLFRRLAPFAGGWTLEAAEAVACARGGEQPDCGVPDALDGLASLADQSLVQVDRPDGGEPRFRLLEIVREHARERLETSGEADATRRRHAAYYLALAGRAGPALQGPEQRAWVARLGPEQGNLRAAVRSFLANNDAEGALQIGSLLGLYWWLGGLLTEGRALLDEAVAGDRDGTAPSRTAALVWGAVLAYGQGDNEQAEAQADAALALARARGERPLEAFAVTVRGLIAWRRGSPATAARLHREALALARDVDDPFLHGDLLYHLGMAEGERDPAAAVGPLAASLGHLRAAGGQHHLLLALGTLADVEARLGRADAALAHFREALALGRTDADPIAAVWVAIFALAFVAELGRADRATPLLASLDAYAATIGYLRTPLEEVAHRRAADAGRAQLGDQGFAAAREGRAALPPQALIAETLAALAATPAPTTASGRDAAPAWLPGSQPLTAREGEVLRLMAEGLDNTGIADCLFIGVGTVKTHVNRLFAKLGATSRTQAVARARARGLLAD